jgi:hypothetical protein
LKVTCALRLTRPGEKLFWAASRPPCQRPTLAECNGSVRWSLVVKRIMTSTVRIESGMPIKNREKT